MGLESGSFISSLVSTNPVGSDPKSQGDDHLRFLKAKILETFPAVTGAVTPTHTELNFVDGVTSAIQTQIDTKGAKAGQVWTGAHDFSGASGVTLPAATSLGTVSAAEVSYLDGVTSAIQTQINTKGAIAGQTWTGTHDFPSTVSFGTVSAAEVSYLDGVTSAIQTQIDTKSPTSSPTFTGTPSAPTPTSGTNTTQIATTAFVINTAMNAQLPSQAGNAFKYLTTDGTNSAWSGVASGLYYSAKSANYTALITDDKTVFDCTSTFTLSFSACATLGNGWSCYVRNSGTGIITLDPNASELIDGVTSGAINPGMMVLIECTSTAFSLYRVGPMAKTEVLTSGTSWTCPIGVRSIRVRAVGGGGGAGGASASLYGNPGGGGAYCERFESVTPGTSYTYAIGAAGAGGATTAHGTAGGNTTWTNSTTITASGGALGLANNIDFYTNGGSATCSGGLAVPGGYGSIVVASSSGWCEGGANPLGKGGAYKYSGSATQIATAGGYGGGGAGAPGLSATSGQNGTAGVIILEY